MLAGPVKDAPVTNQGGQGTNKRQRKAEVTCRGLPVLSQAEGLLGKLSARPPASSMVPRELPAATGLPSISARAPDGPAESCLQTSTAWHCGAALPCQHCPAQHCALGQPAQCCPHTDLRQLQSIPAAVQLQAPYLCCAQTVPRCICLIQMCSP